MGRAPATSLLKATADGNARIDACETDLARESKEARQLVLTVKKLDYGNAAQVRLLLTVADVTDARLAEKLTDDILRQKNDLIREKAILLQELQHRVGGRPAWPLPNRHGGAVEA